MKGLPNMMVSFPLLKCKLESSPSRLVPITKFVTLHYSGQIYSIVGQSVFRIPQPLSSIHAPKGIVELPRFPVYHFNQEHRIELFASLRVFRILLYLKPCVQPGYQRRLLLADMV